MRTALLLLLISVPAFGCKKASAPDPLDAEPSGTATTSDAIGSEVEDLDGDGTGAGGNKNGGGGGAAGADGGGGGGGAGADGGGGGNTADDGGGGSGGGGSGATNSGSGNADGGGGSGGTAGGSGGAPSDPNPTQPGAPYGNVEFVMTGASGGTGTDAVKAALDKSKQRFRGCYGKEPNNSGTLKMRITIATDGVVEKPEVMGGNLALGPLVQCTVAAVKSLKIAGAAAPATKATFDIKYFK